MYTPSGICKQVMHELLFAVIYISIASSICIHILAWSMFSPYTMSKSKRKHPKKCESLKLGSGKLQ